MSAAAVFQYLTRSSAASVSRETALFAKNESGSFLSKLFYKSELVLFSFLFLTYVEIDEITHCPNTRMCTPGAASTVSTGSEGGV